MNYRQTTRLQKPKMSRKSITLKTLPYVAKALGARPRLKYPCLVDYSVARIVSFLFIRYPGTEFTNFDIYCRRSAIDT